jgi:SAM-dependent methyltransferase
MQPGDEEARLDAIYAHRFPGEDAAHEQWRRALWQVLVDDFFSRWLPADGAVLDFGCGSGEFINAVRARRRIGVDARDSARANLEEGVEFFVSEGPLMPGVEDASVDAVFCSNLLEHLPDRETVTALLQEFRRVLSERGKLLVLGPNLRYTGAAYWDFFDHILPFTEHSLAEALATGGFTVERMLPRFLPYSTVGARRTPLPLIRLYLRLPLAWRLLGAQFFAVARPIGSAGN